VQTPLEQVKLCLRLLLGVLSANVVIESKTRDLIFDARNYAQKVSQNVANAALRNRIILLKMGKLCSNFSQKHHPLPRYQASDLGSGFALLSPRRGPLTNRAQDSYYAAQLMVTVKVVVAFVPAPSVPVTVKV
jgi:hypothetical protein